jgi:large conductance mechanosensitive channel
MFGKPIAFLKANLGEFWEFAFKGNLISLAIGVVLGGAFGNLITSFVKNIFMPIIALPGKYFGKSGQGYLGWEWQDLRFGLFIGDLISFLIIALAIFVLMVKVVGWVVKLTRKAPAASDPTEKECPFCLMKIPVKASRCGHCTSDLDGPNSTTAPVLPA